MSNHSYANFDLAIERAGEHYRARVLQSWAGEGSAEFELPFSEYELKYLILQMGHRPRGDERQVRPSDSAELAAAKEFGAKLFGAVFQRDVYACLRASLEEARSREQGLRVLLRLPPELTHLPWEYLYNPDWNQFLSLSLDTPLVRYLELTPAVRPLAVQAPLRVLVVIASPNDYAPLDVEREWRDLQAALQPLVERGRVTVERLENPTLRALQRQLRQGQKYHIFHFIGHGQFNESRQDGRLVFCDPEGRGHLLSGQDLGTLLHNHPSLRLALLNACEGARTAQNDPFSGVAHTLVQMGLPAVIAMQYEISDAAAGSFAQEFYAALADGYEVDAALTEARTAIFASRGSVEWGTPVLFTRTLDGRIFDLALDAQPARPSNDFGSLVEQAPVPAPSASVLTPRLPKSGATPPPIAPDLELARLYEDGLSAFHLEDWPRAQECLQAVVQIRRDYRDAAERLKQAQQQIDLAQHYRQAQELLEQSDWPGALEILEKLAAEAPGYRRVAQRLQYTRQRVHLQALYADATRQSEAGEWRAVVDSFARIAKLQADYPDPQNLLSTAREKLAEQEREEKLASLYGEALQALNNRRWSDAQRLLTQIQKTRPGYRETLRLLEKAQGEMARGKSEGWGGRLMAWVGAHRRVVAVVGLILIGLGGLMYALTNNFSAPGMVPPTASVTPSITLSLTSELAQIASPSRTSTLPPSATYTPTPSRTLTLPPTMILSATLTPTPIVKSTITSTVYPTLPPRMVLIPAGSFLMGGNKYSDEEPVHSVTLNAFLINVHEVTNADYAKCVTDGKCQSPASKASNTRKDYYDNPQYANYPVVNVSWNDAVTYCKWHIEGGRLPTEAEWEKAARGGLENKLYTWGDTPPVCTLGAVNGAQFFGCPTKDTIAVGSFTSNGYGLFDMVGNAWEWVNDWYNENYYSSSPGSNPSGPGPIGNQFRVVRGGWYINLYDVRVALRNPLYTPPISDYNIGFRCAATPP